MKFVSAPAGLIGNTPLVKLSGFAERHGLKAEIYAKLESKNPGGSIKDRVADAMLCEAEQSGQLNGNTVVIEPTSGNTGIALAFACAARGIKMVVVMPDSMSIERRRLIEAYGAELRLTEGRLGMQGAIDEANRLYSETRGGIIAGQFTNPANVAAHYQTTGPELYGDMDGHIDVFVAGVGTGGTISGTGRFLKERGDTHIVAVEPLESPVLSGGSAAPHLIQGIGANFVPPLYDADVVDEIIGAPGQQAVDTMRELSRTDGLLVGISSGAALWAAAQIAGRPEFEGRRIAVIFPDSGERYLV